MSQPSLTDPILSNRLFVDGARRPVCQEERGPYVSGYDGERVYGSGVSVLRPLRVLH